MIGKRNGLAGRVLAVEINETNETDGSPAQIENTVCCGRRCDVSRYSGVNVQFARTKSWTSCSKTGERGVSCESSKSGRCMKHE